MRKKKDIPLSVLKSLEPFVNLRGEKFEVVEPGDNLLKIIDKDVDSNFHFIIEKYQKSGSGPFLYLVTRAPKSVNEIGLAQNWVEASSISGMFDAWIKLLDEYENVISFFDDPIIKTFQEDFYTEFEIIDEDAEINPLKINQILMLDSYLETIDNKLTEFVNEKNSSEIEEIKSDINSLRDNLTYKSKKWVVKKLTTIWAKIAKQGTKFIKEFLSETKKEFIKQGVKGLLEFVNENSNELLS